MKQIKKINLIKKIILNKKANSEEIIHNIFLFFIVTFVIGFVVFLISSNIKSSLDVNDLKFYTFTERLLYNKNCFLFEDIILEPFVFAEYKLNQNQLNKCLLNEGKYLDNIKIGAKIKIFYTKDNKKNEIELYYNKDYYDAVKPISFTNNYKNLAKRYFILIKDDLNIYPGNILIDFVYSKK
ncbi:MAG: hypothetical protein QXM96_01645 [Candidatus Woesearchaeota archaeon]